MSLLDKANALPDTGPLPEEHVDAITILLEKGFSWTSICEWFEENDIKYHKGSLNRRYNEVQRLADATSRQRNIAATVSPMATLLIHTRVNLAKEANSNVVKDVFKGMTLVEPLATNNVLAHARTLGEVVLQDDASYDLILKEES